jgi:hypothetical protein
VTDSTALLNERLAAVAPAGRFSVAAKRIAQIGAGHSLYATFNWFFDNVLYVYVVYNWGMLRGGAVMTALSFAQCAATLIVYQRMRIDWVGAGLIGALRLKPRPSRAESIILWAHDRNRGLIFVALCLFTDPFLTTAYFKEGQFGEITARDWRVFIASVLVSNVYWIFVASLIGHVLVRLWSLLMGSL